MRSDQLSRWHRLLLGYEWKTGWTTSSACLAVADEIAATLAAKKECIDPMCACRGGPCAECPEGKALALEKIASPDPLVTLTQLCFVIRTGGDVLKACEGAEALIGKTMGEAA